MVKNNFDILRIILALIVFYMHMGTLAGIDVLSKLPGELAVKCFFVVSGYLIVKSYLRHGDLLAYAKARFFRIYPLYFVVVSLCFIVGYLNYSLSFIDYLTVGALKYLISNYLFANFLAPLLPEMFIGNVTSAVNGALWTIKVEVMFYLSVPFIYGFLNQYVDNKKLTALLAIFSTFFYYAIGYLIENHSLHHSFNNQLPSMMLFFMVGAFFNFMDLSFLRVSHLILIIPLLFVLKEFHPIYAVLVGLFVYIVAYVVKPIKVSDKIGDVSYGIYIWHFPVIQLLIMHGFFENIYAGFILSSLLVVLLALGSWHFIESKLVHKPS